MEISHTSKNGLQIVEVTGNIALDDIQIFKDYLTPIATSSETHALILDLLNVKIIDSSGFGAILSIYKELRKSSKNFVMCNVNSKNMELFQMLHLDKVFNIESNQVAAIQACS